MSCYFELNLSNELHLVECRSQNWDQHTTDNLQLSHTFLLSFFEQT